MKAIIPKTITLCASASFYKELLEAEERLRKLGFRTKVPMIARRMKRTGDFDVLTVKTWFANPADYTLKTKFMNMHFKKVIESHAILVVNQRKNGIEGYIGGNVLLEMLVAYLYKKPIFILNKIADDLSVREEVFGLQPVFIDGELERIKIK